MPSLHHQWTIKSKRFDKELVAGCRLAAERQGMAMGDWCVEALREAVRVTLTGPGAGSPPARLEDVAGTLAEMITTMAETQEQRLAQIGRDQAIRLDAIRRETKRGRWRR